MNAAPLTPLLERRLRTSPDAALAAIGRVLHTMNREIEGLQRELADLQRQADFVVNRQLLPLDSDGRFTFPDGSYWQASRD